MLKNRNVSRSSSLSACTGWPLPLFFLLPPHPLSLTLCLVCLFLSQHSFRPDFLSTAHQLKEKGFKVSQTYCFISRLLQDHCALVIWDVWSVERLNLSTWINSVGRSKVCETGMLHEWDTSPHTHIWPEYCQVLREGKETGELGQLHISKESNWGPWSCQVWRWTLRWSWRNEDSLVQQMCDD